MLGAEVGANLLEEVNRVMFLHFNFKRSVNVNKT